MLLQNEIILFRIAQKYMRWDDEIPHWKVVRKTIPVSSRLNRFRILFIVRTNFSYAVSIRRMYRLVEPLFFRK